MFPVSTPQSHRYYCSKKDSLLGLPSPEQAQQVHGHRQMGFLLSKGGCGQEGVRERLLWGAEVSWAPRNGIKCLIPGTHFVAVYLFHFTNAPVGFQAHESCARAENVSHCERTWLLWLAASRHPHQRQADVCDTQDTQQHRDSPQLMFMDKGRTIAEPEAHCMGFTMPCHQTQPPAAFMPEQRVLQNNWPGLWRAKAGSGWIFCFPPHWFIKHN